MSTRLIINPTAGAHRAHARLEAHLRTIHARWPRLEVCTSRSAEHLTELAAEAARRGLDRVLVAGGDGTVHFVANGLAGSQTALGIIPVGSGNDIARSVGLPSDTAAAVAMLVQDHAVAIDVGRVKDRVFCCVLGVGMDTPAIQRIQAARVLRRGKLLYAAATLRTLLTYRPPQLTIEGESMLFDGPAMFAAVTNTATYAGGMQICPDADVTDGALDLCAIPQLPMSRLLRAFGSVFDGGHTAMAGVVTRQAHRLVLRSPHPLPVTLDGELTELRTDLEVTVWPGALRLLANPRFVGVRAQAPELRAA